MCQALGFTDHSGSHPSGTGLLLSFRLATCKPLGCTDHSGSHSSSTGLHCACFMMPSFSASAAPQLLPFQDCSFAAVALELPCTCTPAPPGAPPHLSFDFFWQSFRCLHCETLPPRHPVAAGPHVLCTGVDLAVNTHLLLLLAERSYGGQVSVQAGFGPCLPAAVHNSLHRVFGTSGSMDVFCSEGMQLVQWIGALDEHQVRRGDGPHSLWREAQGGR